VAHAVHDRTELREAVHAPYERLRDALQRVELAGAYQRAARARREGTPQVELAALEHIELRGGLTPGELGHRLGLTSGGVTALTGRLIDAGYVRRERHPSDGRMRILGVTEAGTECLRAHVEPVLEVADAAFSTLPDADAERLADALELLASLKNADAAATPGPEREYESDGYSRALLM
jgi:DNA-binding MarR family transcriptional regulator